MEVKFNEEYLRDLYETGKSDKKHRFQPQIIKRYVRVIDLMMPKIIFMDYGSTTLLIMSVWKEINMDCLR